MRKVAITGHRPGVLFKHKTYEELYNVLEKVFDGLKPDQIITGMALGADQMAAEAAMYLGIPFLAAIPFEGQADRWKPEQIEKYLQLLEWANEIEIISEDPKGRYEIIRALHDRNKWMVDRASVVVAMWNGAEKGGTAHCVRYARRVQSKRKLHIIRIDTASGEVSRVT